MMIKLKSRIINRTEQSLHEEVENYPVRLVEYSYELDDVNCKGLAKVHYLVHEMEVDDSAPVLFRGFMKFEGELYQQEGSFLAHEDGAIHQGSITVKGRIVDATGDLFKLVGTYASSQLLTDDEFEMIFDVDL